MEGRRSKRGGWFGARGSGQSEKGRGKREGEQERKDATGAGVHAETGSWAE